MTLPPKPQLKRLAHWALLAFFAILLGPLVLASITLPFGWTDHFAAIRMYLHYGCCSADTILPNVVWHLLYNDYVVRPTATLAYALQFRVFGGEFWLWFLAKWTLKFAAALWVTQILRNLRVGLGVRWCAAAFVLFHPISTEFNLFSLDLMASASCLLVLRILVVDDDKDVFDVARLSGWRYAALLAAYLLALGVKEICFAYCGVLTVALTLWSERSRRTALRLAPFYLALVFIALRLAANAHRAAALTAQIFIANITRHLQFMAPQSPFEILTFLLLALLAFSLYRLVRGTQRAERRVILFCWTAALAMLAITSVITRPYYGASTRYVVPSLFLLSVPLGLAWAALPRSWMWAQAVFLLAYPLFQMEDLAVQALGWQQHLFEQADVVNLLLARSAEGYQLATADDTEFAGEVAENVELFFSTYGPQMYSQRPAWVGRFPRDRMKGPFAVVSAYAPVDFAKHFGGRIEPGRLQKVQTFTLGGYGVLERYHRRFWDFNIATHNVHFARYDPVGAPQFRETLPVYYVYSFRRAGSPSSEEKKDVDAAVDSRLPLRWGYGKAEKTVELPAGGEWDAANSGEFAVKVALPTNLSGNTVDIAADYRITAPQAFYGVVTADRKQLHVEEIHSDGKTYRLPPLPPLPLEYGKDYFAFIYFPRGPVKIRLTNVEGMRFGQVEVLKSSRRFGAITR